LFASDWRRGPRKITQLRSTTTLGDTLAAETSRSNWAQYPKTTLEIIYFICVDIFGFKLCFKLGEQLILQSYTFTQICFLLL